MYIVIVPVGLQVLSINLLLFGEDIAILSFQLKQTFNETLVPINRFKACDEVGFST